MYFMAFSRHFIREGIDYCWQLMSRPMSDVLVRWNTVGDSAVPFSVLWDDGVLGNISIFKVFIQPTTNNVVPAVEMADIWFYI